MKILHIVEREIVIYILGFVGNLIICIGRQNLTDDEK